jgi:hypothetical protein
MKSLIFLMKFSWRVPYFFGWKVDVWRMNWNEIHTPTVQYISHKWMKNKVWFSNHIPHINGWLQYDFPTARVQYISHDRINYGMIFQLQVDEIHLNGWIRGVWKVWFFLWNSVDGSLTFLDENLMFRGWIGMKFILRQYNISHING